MMGGAGSEGVQEIPKTLEEVEATCVHVWRDQSEKDGLILQECIRCKKTRSLSLT